MHKVEILKIRCAHIISTSLASCLEREKMAWGILWRGGWEKPLIWWLFRIQLCGNDDKRLPWKPKEAAVLQHMPLYGRNSSCVVNSHTNWPLLFTSRLMEFLVLWCMSCWGHAEGRAPWGQMGKAYLAAVRTLTTVFRVFISLS